MCMVVGWAVPYNAQRSSQLPHAHQVHGSHCEAGPAPLPPLAHPPALAPAPPLFTVSPTRRSGLAVLKYVIAMARTMDASPLSCRKCGDQGCDQAVHNYLMHVAAKQPGRLGFNVTRWGNCESPLYTLMMVFAAGYSVQMVRREGRVVRWQQVG